MQFTPNPIRAALTLVAAIHSPASTCLAQRERENAGFIGLLFAFAPLLVSSKIEKADWPMFLFSREMTGIEPGTSCFPKEVGGDIINNDQSLRIPAYPVCFPHLDLRWPMKSKMHVKNISKCFMNVHTPIIDIVYCIYLTSFPPNSASQIKESLSLSLFQSGIFIHYVTQVK